jgi:formylglycine-generating enzyme
MKTRMIVLTGTMAIITGIVFYCGRNPIAGNGTETGNPVVAMVYNQGGTPAANAKVCFYPRDFDPHTGQGSGTADSTTTDSSGNYSIVLDSGTYNVLVQGDSGLAFQDSIRASGGTSLQPPACTLKTPGTIGGVVELELDGDPRTVFILFLGTHSYTTPDDASGNFISEPMAAGKYRVRILTTLPDYEIMDTSFIIRSRVDSVIPEPLVLKYTGIPTPKNLIVSYDTLNETVLLSWDIPDTTLISGYNIYRSIKGQNFSLITQTPLPETQIVFQDNNGLMMGNVYEYRVVSRIPFGTESKMIDYDTDTVLTVSRSMVTTTFLWNAMDTASINDTVTVMVSFSNPTRRINHLEWHIDTAQTPIRSKGYSSLAGSDTLVYYCSSQAGVVRFIAKATDNAGTIWRDTLNMQVVQDIPAVNAGNDAGVLPNDTVYLHGSATQQFGTIIMWEWNIENGGFKQTSGSDTFFIAVDTTIPNYRCILRATDDDGNMAEDTVLIFISDMKFILGGTFQMGQVGVQNAEPVHSVTVSSFMIDKSEIMQGQYYEVSGQWKVDTATAVFGGGYYYPLYGLTWFDAVVFCNERSKREGRDTVYNTSTWEADFSKNGYRLPTEAEWEYACRAGTTTTFYWGEDTSEAVNYSWCTTNSGMKMHPVATKLPNAWGLYDMSGNVFEWCNDWFGETYYQTSPSIDPTGPGSGSNRIIRGGHFSAALSSLTSADRGWGCAPDAMLFVYTRGLRCVRKP